MAFARAIATIGGLTMVSRVLGFIRDIMIAAILGAGFAADCFFVAFKLPNFFRRLFAEGAFNAAFVPLFSQTLEREGAEAARRFAQEALAGLLVVLVAFVALAQASMPWLMIGLAPGFVDEPEKFTLAVQLTRITFPYLAFISLVSLLGGVLNALGRFAAVAATPVLLNLCLIGALMLAAPLARDPAHMLAFGVSAGGVAQLVWLLIETRRAGFSLRLPRPRITVRLRALLALVTPGAIGAGVVQINLMIDVVIASFLPTGSLSYLFYADRLNQLPIGIIGVAIGTALLPTLSRHYARGERAQALITQNRAIEIALLFTLPAAAALMIMPEPLISALFERRAFGAAETVATAGALAAYALGLPAYVLIKVLTPGYFSRQDTKSPVRFAVIALIVNTALNLALMIPLKHIGLALATALSAWLNVALLAHGLAGQGYFRTDARLRRRLVRIVLATAVMAAGLIGLLALCAGLLAAGGAERIGALAVLVLGGLVIYGAACRLTGAVDFGELNRMLAR